MGSSRDGVPGARIVLVIQTILETLKLHLKRLLTMYLPPFLFLLIREIRKCPWK